MEELQGTVVPSNSNRGFQVGWRTLAECLASLLSTVEAGPLFLAIFCCLGSFWGTTSPSSTISFSFIFFFKLGRGEQANCRKRRGGGAGRGWDPEVPLFLYAKSSFRPFFLFRVISSSSSKLLSIQATMSLGEQIMKDLSSSPFEFDISAGSSCASPSSSRRNWSISALRDRCEEVVSSLGVTTSRGEWWWGSSTGERSSQARKPGTETSIQASQGLPALIAWPISWNLSDKGSKSRMRWTALNCLPSPTYTSDLSTLLKRAKLTRLRLGATCLLSAKTSEEEKHG